MFKILILVVLSTSLMATLGNQLKCYHCYENVDSSGSKSVKNPNKTNDTFVECGNDKGTWNTWECPTGWLRCVTLAGNVNGQYQIIRSCAMKNFCSSYKAPTGVSLDYCSECSTSLCNEIGKNEDEIQSSTESPTELPTESPTKLPTESLTELPTESPTKLPTESPTELPTESPTKLPTESPTELPTESPTKLPTESPTELPTESPTSPPPPPPPDPVPQFNIVFNIVVNLKINQSQDDN